jgi:hypothetical protein
VSERTAHAHHATHMRHGELLVSCHPSRRPAAAVKTKEGTSSRPLLVLGLDPLATARELPGAGDVGEDGSDTCVHCDSVPLPAHQPNRASRCVGVRPALPAAPVSRTQGLSAAARRRRLAPSHRPRPARSTGPAALRAPLGRRRGVQPDLRPVAMPGRSLRA